MEGVDKAVKAGYEPLNGKYFKYWFLGKCMRLFIAIHFNELKEYFYELQKQLPENAKLSLTKSFHMTLKFLGEVQPEKVDEIIGILKTIKFEKFKVFLDSMGIFPTENHIRVVWAGLKPEAQV